MPFHPPNASAGGSDRDPARVVDEIASDDGFRAGLGRLAAELQRPGPDLEREARTALSEMVAVQSPPVLDAIDRLAQFALRAYDIEVDADALDGLRSLNRRHALVFLPSHKSYLDPFILRGALGRAGLPVNHVLGGINVSFWPMGPVLRRSGVVFIRRSVKDDAVYKFTLRSYLGYLVDRRYNLEWYLEGGRSRTGKLRPPRLGVLAYLVEAFRERGIDDVYLVPVSIAYDQLQEVAAMAAEEHGAPKKAESLAWMLKYIRSQGQRLGKAYVNVAEPLSLRQVGTGPSQAPDGVLVGKIAFEVLHRINRVDPGHPDLAAHPGSPRAGRPGAHPGRDPVGARPASRLRRRPQAAPGRNGRSGHAGRAATGPRRPRHHQGRHPLRRRRRAGLRHRREPAPRGGVQPQPHHPLFRHPGHHRARAAAPRPPPR